MELWQILIVFLFGAFSFLSLIRGYYESKYKKNAYGENLPIGLIGAFVWGDAVIFGIFWTLVTIVTILLKDWVLFLLFYSVFWVVRSLGETIYWFNQQFSSIDRNPIQKVRFNNIFHNNSVWFIHQIIWQCITVVSLILTLYLSKIWLSRF